MPSFFDNILSAIGSQPPPQQDQNNVFGRLVAGLGNDPSQIPGMGPVNVAQGMTMADAGPAPSIAPQGAGRPRRSVLDMIGGLADTIATVGGADPLYQRNLDAQLARDNAAQDRSREIDLDGLRKQLLENQVAAGGQNLEAGQLGIQDARNQLLESAGNGLRQVFGRSGADGLAKAWPLIAGQLGIPEEQAAQIGQALTADPEGTLAAIFPTQPVANGGSQAKEAQIFALLKSQGTPEMAQAYLASLTNPDAMTPYQMEALRLAREKFGFDQYKFNNPPPSAAERTMTAKEAAAAAQKDQAVNGALSFLDDLERTVTALDKSGGMTRKDQTIAGTLGAAARENLPLVERIVSPEGFAAREELDGLLTQGVSSLLPMLTGMTIGPKNMDAAKEMENLKRAVISAKSADAAMSAIRRYRQNLQQRQQQPSAPRTSGAPAPRQRGTAPRTRQRQGAPAVGTVEQGWRFNGGNPADRKNWTKVR